MSAALRECGRASFPAPRGLFINMMPVIHGEPSSVPEELHGYLALMSECAFERGATVYLTVHESLVARAQHA